MSFVIDASIVLAWSFEDEQSGHADAVVARLASGPAVAPAIWPLEVANAIAVAERRGRINRSAATRAGEMIAELPVEIQPAALADVLSAVVPVAREQGLSVYDASYLALALARGLPLATGDGRLAAAARAVGVPPVEG